MILGTHNSMTYLQPLRWYLWPFKWMAKCQKYNFKEQYNLGVRFFDFRIIFKYKHTYLPNPTFAHGSMDFDLSVNLYLVLDWLEQQDEPVYCRIILEKGDDMCKDYFIACCQYCEEHYHNIVFTDARDKKSWKLLYYFSGQMPAPLVDKYASCNQTGETKWKGILKAKNYSGLLIDDIWPWIYAVIHNKKTLKNYKNHDVVLLMDFVEKNYV